MSRRLSGRLSLGILAAVIGLMAGVPGCHRAPARRDVPFDPPLAKSLVPADDPACGPGVALASPLDCQMRRPRHILALSGGGAYGAYSAGFIAGWTQSGQRPEFDVVTGISTGSLIAPFAFLGPDCDDQLGHLYTRVQAADVFKLRAWYTIPFKDAVASSAPLRRLIESQITTDLMTRIAAEHRKGRRLYVGTTNLDTRRLVVWDMGAIACRPCPEGCLLFRDVLLASCSVPGMFPPVKFDIDVDGKKASELHVDGGVTAQLFVPSQVFAAAAQGAAADMGLPVLPPGAEMMPTSANLYVIVAGKLYPDASAVRRRVLPVLDATTGAVLYAHCRADLANLYGLCRASGVKYHLAALPPGFRTLESSVDFDQKEMKKLFAEGTCEGAATNWLYGPPTLTPSDGDFIRNGTRLRTPPPDLTPPGPPAAGP